MFQCTWIPVHAPTSTASVYVTGLVCIDINMHLHTRKVEENRVKRNGAENTKCDSKSRRRKFVLLVFISFSLISTYTNHEDYSKPCSLRQNSQRNVLNLLVIQVNIAFCSFFFLLSIINIHEIQKHENRTLDRNSDCSIQFERSLIFRLFK